VKIRVRDVSHGDRVTPRAIVMQQKTQRPVQFEFNGARVASTAMVECSERYA